MTVKEELTTLKKRSLIVDTEDEDDFEKISDEKNNYVILDQDSSKQQPHASDMCVEWSVLTQGTSMLKSYRPSRPHPPGP